jgi:hypothetical protein
MKKKKKGGKRKTSKVARIFVGLELSELYLPSKL